MLTEGSVDMLMGTNQHLPNPPPPTRPNLSPGVSGWDELTLISESGGGGGFEVGLTTSVSTGSAQPKVRPLTVLSTMSVTQTQGCGWRPRTDPWARASTAAEAAWHPAKARASSTS